MKEIHKWDLGVLGLAATELGAVTWFNLAGKHEPDTLDKALVIGMSASILALATVCRKQFKDKLQGNSSSNR